MTAHSLARHWPVILSRLGLAGLSVVERPGGEVEIPPGSSGGWDED
jgi:hypothetical protein